MYKINRMKYILPLILSCYLLSSCATVLNGSKTNIKVYTPEPVTITTPDSTYTTNKHNKVKIKLKRAKESAEILVDGQKIVLDSELSPAFWLGAHYALSGIGLLGLVIDLTNPRRHTYQKVLYMIPTDSIPALLDYRPQNRKGEIHFNFSGPYSFGHYHIHPPSEIQPLRSVGIFGLGFGVDYYHSPKQYFSLKTQINSNRLLFPRPKETGGFYGSLSNHHKIKRLTLGYGVSYTNTFFNPWSEYGPSPPRSASQNLGLFFSGYYQTGGYFYIGIDYRPTFIRISSGSPSQYEHLIGLNFVWKIE